MVLAPDTTLKSTLESAGRSWTEIRSCAVAEGREEGQVVRAQTGQQCARNNTLSVCVYAVLVGASNGADNEFKLHCHDR